MEKMLRLPQVVLGFPSNCGETLGLPVAVLDIPHTRSMKKDPRTGERGMSSTAHTATGSPRVSYIPH